MSEPRKPPLPIASCLLLFVSTFFVVGTTSWMFGPGNTTDWIPILLLVTATTSGLYAIKFIKGTVNARVGTIVSSALGALTYEALQGPQVATSHLEPIMIAVLVTGGIAAVLLHLEETSADA